MAKKKEPLTLKSSVVFDPISKKFTQKDHVVHGNKVIPYQIGVCDYCSNEFPRHRKRQRFCSGSCRMKWWLRKQHNGEDPNYGVEVCPIDGTVFTKTRPWSKYCSLECQAKGRTRINAENRRQRQVAEPELESVETLI